MLAYSLCEIHNFLSYQICINKKIECIHPYQLVFSCGSVIKQVSYNYGMINGTQKRNFCCIVVVKHAFKLSQDEKLWLKYSKS